MTVNGSFIFFYPLRVGHLRVAFPNLEIAEEWIEDYEQRTCASFTKQTQQPLRTRPSLG